MLPKKPDSARLDKIVAAARHSAEQRERGYREMALKRYPWICGRCLREFTQANLSQLTVHHRKAFSKTKCNTFCCKVPPWRKFTNI